MNICGRATRVGSDRPCVILKGGTREVFFRRMSLTPVYR